MNEIEEEYIIKKNEEKLKECKEYQLINKEIIKLERELISKLNKEELNIFLKINDLTLEQEAIFAKSIVNNFIYNYL